MSFLRGLLWCLFFIALLAIGMYVTGNFAVSDYLTSFFLSLQPYLPLQLNFDQFLVVVTVVSLIVVAIVVSGCAGLIIYLGGRLSVAQQKQFGQAAASRRELGHVKEQQERQHQQLISLGQMLTKKLDKRILVQTLVEAASSITSVPQANSITSLWQWHFETDTLRFEMGRYCDESLYSRTEFAPTDMPFARVMQAQKPWLAQHGEKDLEIVKPEKAAQLGAATSVMIVPLIVEGTALGVLIVHCHPDVLKSYEQQRAFYDAMWGELSLALAIAIQGELAIIDRLTGVHNREYFMKRFIQEIDRANRYQFPLSVLMVDIDNFKAVNDMLGHPQGDAVLKIISKLIKKEIRAIDLLGRYGGEEFILLLPETGLGDDASSASGALLVAERIRKAVADEFQGLQKPLGLSISLGVAVRRFPQDREMDYKELIRLSDEQLYRAKTTGKNKVCVYTPDAPQGVT